MRPAQSPPHLFTLVILTGVSVVTLNMILPSLAQMAEEFGVSYGYVNLAISGYLAITAVVQLLIGPLSDRYGRRPVLLVSVGIFVLASLGCLLAQEFRLFLVCRLVQGAIASGQVLSRAIIRDMHPPNKAASLMGYVAMSMALAPMLAPVLGGALHMLWGWRAGFALFSLLGIAILALLWVDLGETNGNRTTRFGQQLHDYPFLLKSRRFWGYSLCIAFSVGGFFTFITGAPLVASAWFDLSPAMLGLGIGIITTGFMAGNFVTGRMAARTGLMTLILWGRSAATAGPLIGLALFLFGQGSLWVFFGAAVAVGFGNGLTIANASAGLLSVRPNLAGTASGLSGALAVGLGAILTSSTGAIVTTGNAPFAVLGLMSLISGLGLLAALYVRRCDRIDPLPDAG
ncbi:multidrug effflux MFS transporter [Microbulbifer sp. S227A]|uniref:multidrug effflux MFS transporter n=1 Tax=Microbulbifer sp. S227A TaxID=3415131 RepID=UPI003C7A0745